MSNLGVNDGHTKSGPGSGAVGRISESKYTREVGNEVRRIFKERGNTVFNCTVDYAATTSESLALVVQQANRENLDWFISIHFNAGCGQGVEVYTYEGRQYQDAIDVCKNISTVLGIPNRGVKVGTGLYVIRKTKAKSMLIEVCFVDSNDADKYLNVGCTAVAQAIVDGLEGHISNNVIKNDGFNEEEYYMNLFSENWYLYRYNDVAEAVKKGSFKSGYEHYVKYGKNESPKRQPVPPMPKEFNEGDYLELNKDVAEAIKKGDCTSGAQHYMLNGFKESHRKINKGETDEAAKNRIAELEAKLEAVKKIVD